MKPTKADGVVESRPLASADRDLFLVRNAARGSRGARVSAATTAYGLALVGVMFGAMVVAALMGALARDVPAGVAAWVPWVVAVASCAGLILAFTGVGPAHAEPAVARWLLATPIRRWWVVRSRVRLTWLLGSAGGSACGVVVALTTHPGQVEWARAAIGCVAGAAVGSAAFTMALAAQSRAKSSFLRTVARAVSLASCALVALGLGHGWQLSIPDGAGWAATVSATVAGVVVSLVGARRAPSWVDVTRTGDVTRAGQVVSAAVGSLLMLDAGLLDAGRARRRMARRGRARSQASRGPAPLDATIRDMRACLRRWPEIAGALACLVPAIAIGELFGDAIGLVMITLVAWIVASRAADGLTQWLGSSSLWRSVPQEPVTMTVSLTMAPAMMTLVVAAAGAVLFDASPWFVVACVTGVTAGLVRRAQRPDMQLGTLVDTGMGLLPIGIVVRIVCGFDLVVIVLLVGTRSWVAAAILGLVLCASRVGGARPGAG